MKNTEHEMKEMTQPVKETIHISVRNLVEFIFRNGDIDDRHASYTDSMAAMRAGSRVHKKIQKKQGADYHPEVFLKFIVSFDAYDLGIEGRADGIIYNDDIFSENLPVTSKEKKDPVEIIKDEKKQKVIIDEIKGMYLDVTKMEEPFLLHLAQAKCYAFIFASQKHLSEIQVQMTYCSLDSYEEKKFKFNYTFSELEEWFQKLIASYKKWADFEFNHRKKRQQSISQMTFPFTYREGQKELARDVYLTILRQQILFIQAPTGAGKTLSALFPAVKAVGENLGEKIFYLTSKTVTGVVAKNTFQLFGERGYHGKTIEITAKDRICPLEEKKCNPDDCPYAKGHFDRVNDAVFEFLQKNDLMEREEILSFAKERRVCPFEFSLDLSSWADNIICDYNYVFDPQAYLKRFFAEGSRGDYIFLIDEAHNLVERARQMYSADLVKEDFLKMSKWIKPYSSEIDKNLKKCNRILLAWKKQCEKRFDIQDMDELLFALLHLSGAMERFFEKNRSFPKADEVRDFYFQLRSFLNLTEGYDEHYKLYCDYDAEDNFIFHLFCVDPSRLLQERLNRGNATVFFSATLLPIAYYKRLLCTKKEPYAVYADSAFDRKKCLVLIGTDVTSQYKRRSIEEYSRYALYIKKIVSQKQGNYMVFFPSYRFLEDVYTCFLNLVNVKEASELRLICQQSGMDAEKREAFLEEFEQTNEKTLLAFCVMGGIFSEGIDLKEDRLIGAIIVGTALPQVGNRQEILREYFEEQTGNGFEYAYLYPGMNKVMQSAGRVIRTENDRGLIALLDERFLQSSYQKIFPREWKDFQTADTRDIATKTATFWEQQTTDDSN